jgi:hypothetical protein
MNNLFRKAACILICFLSFEVLSNEIITVKCDYASFHNEEDVPIEDIKWESKTISLDYENNRYFDFTTESWKSFISKSDNKIVLFSKDSDFSIRNYYINRHTGEYVRLMTRKRSGDILDGSGYCKKIKAIIPKKLF